MDQFHAQRKPGKVWVGFILLVIGVILLINTLGFYIPDWIISFPTFLLAIGIMIGMRSKFKHPASFILIFIGTALLPEEIIPGLDFHNFIWPIAIIVFGIYLIVGRNKVKKHFIPSKERPIWDAEVKEGSAFADDVPPAPEDYLDTVSIFGGVKKHIISKNFKGGDIVTIMGGAEINLIESDFNGTIILEVTQIFGGTKIVLPPHWKVSSEMVAIFGGIEDKRRAGSDLASSDKVLIIRGTSIFGGIEVRSF